ncbi:MAG: type II secretion system protein GspE, partial [Nitrospirota bacterium]
LYEDNEDYRIRTAYRAKGCDICNRIGYVGRMAIGEIIVVNDEIRELISEGASLNKLKAAALRNGMVPFRLNGIKKAIEGITSIEEIIRVVG